MQTAFEEAAVELLEEFGDLTATLEPNGQTAVPLPVLVNYNTQLFGEEMQTLTPTITIEFLISSGQKPKRGDKIHADGRSFTVERTYQKTNIWHKLIVK